MIVLLTERPSGPNVIVTMTAQELAALLAGHTEQFALTIAGQPTTIQLLSSDYQPPKGRTPDVRLRVQPGALRAARVSTVTPIFADVPFTLTLLCSDPPTGPVEIEPGTFVGPPLRPAAATAPSPAEGLRDRLLIALIPGAVIALYGYVNHGGPVYYLIAAGTAAFGFFRKT